MKENINRLQVIDFSFPPPVCAAAYFRLMDFKLEGLLGFFSSFYFFFSLPYNNRHGFMASILKMGNFPYGPCLPAGLIMF